MLSRLKGGTGEEETKESSGGEDTHEEAETGTGNEEEEENTGEEEAAQKIKDVEDKWVRETLVREILGSGAIQNMNDKERKKGVPRRDRQRFK